MNALSSLVFLVAGIVASAVPNSRFHQPVEITRFAVGHLTRPLALGRRTAPNLPPIQRDMPAKAVLQKFEDLKLSV